MVESVIKLVRWASLLFTGLFSGFLLGVLVLENSLRKYDATIYTQVRHVELDRLDTLASATLLPALISTLVIASLAIRAGEDHRWLLTAAFVLLAVVLVTSLVVNLPINGDQAEWSVQAPPPDWASVRDNWQLAHVVRTVAAVLAFCSLTAALSRTARRTTGAATDSALESSTSSSHH